MRGDTSDPQKKSVGAPSDPSATEAAVASASPAAASTGSSLNDAVAEDMTIAMAIHAFESLTVLYGFSAEATQEAIDHANANGMVGGDIVAYCCDYILDRGLGIDAGGAIAPIDNCPHVVNTDVCESEDSQCGCISVTAETIPENIFEMQCGYLDEVEKTQTKKAKGGFKDDIEYTSSGGATCPKGENWWCLKCGGIYCSRYVNGHGVKHYEDNPKHHCVMIGLADLSVWCHCCGAYLQTQHNKRLSSILQRLQDIKFGNN